MPAIAQTPAPAGPSPIGMVYNTSMGRPDAALALAAMYVIDNKHDAKMGAVCVTGAGLKAAMFCDMVGTVYVPGPPRNGNQALAVGLADVSPLPPDPPMVLAAVDRKKPNGDPLYAHSVEKLTDTSQAEAVLRNGVTFNAESIVVASAPVSFLLKSLDLLGVKALYQARVKRFVIVDAGAPDPDPAALRRLLADWPTPIVYAGPELGEALTFPGARLDHALGWTPNHPVLDAYRAFKPMPYDAPTYDLAALHYAVYPTSGLFTLSDPGALGVTPSGGLRWTPGTGAARRLAIDAAKIEQAREAFVTLIGTAPVAPPQRGRGAA